jgi:hypothetical protein
VVVGFRTSIGCARDAAFLGLFDVLVATEYDLAVGDEPGLFPIPFAVHDDMVTMFMASGELELYLSDDLGYFRRAYAEPKVRRAGFGGCGGYGRKTMESVMPEWCDAQFDKYMLEREYVRYIMGCEAGLLFAGCTPKTYQFSELALFGIPIITTPIATRIVPPLTSENCIEVSGWDDWAAMEAGMLRLDEVRRGADRDYVAGWSIMGQAKQLTEMLRPIV